MNPPANWYPDPTGRHGQRYWDGGQWTEHVFTDGVQGVDPLEVTQAEEGDERGQAAAEAAEQGQPNAEAAEQGQPDEADEQGWAEEGADGAATETGDASGLFAAAGEGRSEDVSSEAATEASPAAEAEGSWSPQDQPGTAEAEDEHEDVAPEVEPEDVVGSLDEVAQTEEPEETAPADDFSDAFMVTPETVSRLVTRQAASEPQPASDPEPAPAETTEATSIEQVGDATEQAADTDDELADMAPPAPEGTDEAAPPTATEPAPGSGAIDAPPPTVPDEAGAGTAAAPTGQVEGQITGDLVSGAFAEQEQAGPVSLQNARLLRCSLGDGPGVIARQGTMVAYQGEVAFERQGAGGVTRALKRAATGEGLAMMRAEGSGDVFFADGGQHVFLLHIDGGPGLSVNGRNVLAFSAELQWDIERVKGATLLAGGLFNTSLTGTGWVALVSDGQPVVLRTGEAPTHVDVNALVAWSGGLRTQITNTVTAKSLVGLGSGEAFQMSFEGAGIVVVQPSEGPTGGAAAT